jgi:hypothetical protein
MAFLDLGKIMEKQDTLSRSNASESLNSFHKASITLTPKPKKDISREENCKSISLMKTNVEILNKILANTIQQHIKRIIYHAKVRLIPAVQG